MEKLIELLDEYEYFKELKEIPEKDKDLFVQKNFWCESYGVLNSYGCEDYEILNRKFCKMYAISKEYGFIKRLVDNDKIDQTVIDGNFGYFCMEGFDTVDSLLMVLAIQDEPIDFLIEILK